MGYFFLGLAAVLALAVLWRVISTAPPERLTKILKWGGLSLAIAGGLVLLFRSASGAGLLAAGVTALMLYRGLRASGAGFSWNLRGQSPSSGQSSAVETEWLRMSLDHDTGVSTGVILKGVHAGARLEDLDFAELMQVLGEARIHDPDAAHLLEAYIARAHAGAWEASGDTQGQGPHGGAMTMAEALEILGLDEGASASDIREAHKRLMLQMHPDRGGSDYLAAKINQARDVLLGA